MRLQGKVALITGAASGIGRSAAVRFAAEGARVVIVDLDEANGVRTAEELRASGAEALFLRCDATSESEAAAAVSQTAARFGGLDVLLCGAGILEGAYRSVEETSLATFSRVMDVNVLGTFLFCKHAAPALRAPGGVVLCLASGAGVLGPSSSLAYGASKAGVFGFCRTLERQFEPRGIRVNVVCPGSVDTPMKRRNVLEGARAEGSTLSDEEVLAGRPLTAPEDVAAVLAFLASDEARCVSGTIVTR